MAERMRPLLILLLLLTPRVLAGDGRRYDAGDRLMAQGRYDDALSLWTGALASEAENPELLLRAGVACSMLRDFPRAEAFLLAARRFAPDDPKMVYNCALLEMRRGNSAAAGVLLKETLRECPWFPGAAYHLGVLAEREGRPDQAREYYLREMNADHASALAWSRLQRDCVASSRDCGPRRASETVLTVFLAILGAAALAAGVVRSARDEKGRAAT
ncbi:MAG: tetratricopeptide repeat protein [Planctomycetota bacterium]